MTYIFVLEMSTLVKHANLLKKFFKSKIFYKIICGSLFLYLQYNLHPDLKKNQLKIEFALI